MQPDLSPEHRANLATLATYLDTQVPDKSFGMRTYAEFAGERLGILELPNVQHACGTVCCAAGCGILAGILVPGVTDWRNYTNRAFGALDCSYDHRGRRFEWLFAPSWSTVDNTPRGAAARIRYMLDHGVPDDAYAQRDGTAPLCYTVPPLVDQAAIDAEAASAVAADLGTAFAVEAEAHWQRYAGVDTDTAELLHDTRHMEPDERAAIVRFAGVDRHATAATLTHFDALPPFDEAEHARASAVHKARLFLPDALAARGIDPATAETIMRYERRADLAASKGQPEKAEKWRDLAAKLSAMAHSPYAVDTSPAADLAASTTKLAADLSATHFDEHGRPVVADDIGPIGTLLGAFVCLILVFVAAYFLLP